MYFDITPLALNAFCKNKLKIALILRKKMKLFILLI